MTDSELKLGIFIYRVAATLQHIDTKLEESPEPFILSMKHRGVDKEFFDGMLRVFNEVGKYSVVYLDHESVEIRNQF